ncbi:ABC transporter ATP-binding protein [Clavibacter michiganensis subsp. michiganensis]|uniref:dipeptide ABC transporter ATP-binding protein n=1 Tax=Clavibacter michiganensis TaxID=28447 RepID=UPI001C64B55E|nr:ABC transporter ATP-binding protein [Clavibacter michiganensis]MBW8026497.1 ABC transporter ATP-binding protein [Clavibacter michiganensis subsp. michiganensis]
MTDGSGPVGAAPALRVEDLRVSFDGVPVVHGVSLRIAPGECLALVGTSGSGKSVTAGSLLGLAGPGADVRADVFEIGGRDLRDAGPREWRRVRGSGVGLVLQDALSSLDPLRPIGREIGDALRVHGMRDPRARRARVLELLERVGMPDPATRVHQRSGELSGGLRQRALLAAALALDPPLLVADEPTTALDATVQARIIDLLADLRSRGQATLLVSHDLAVVARLADRVAVMHDGRVVEEGPTAEILRTPAHRRTRALVAAVPTGVPRGTPLSEARLEAAASAPAWTAEPRADDRVVLRATGLTRSYRRPGGSARTAVDDVSLEVRRGRTLGLVGGSGSGKTTVARLLLALEEPDAGDVTLDGEPWSGVPERARRSRRARIGAVYQDPLASFDPRWSVDRILRDALAVAGLRGASAFDSPGTLLAQVGLDPALLPRRPARLSGGQRQRVAIARALAARPDVLICDEPVSALDIAVQAQVLDLLDELQRRLGLGLLLISHDLGVVAHMSDEVAVMADGRVVERGSADDVLLRPTHPVTRALLAAVPRLDPDAAPR